VIFALLRALHLFFSPSLPPRFAAAAGPPPVLGLFFCIALRPVEPPPRPLFSCNPLVILPPLSNAGFSSAPAGLPLFFFPSTGSVLFLTSGITLRDVHSMSYF